MGQDNAIKTSIRLSYGRVARMTPADISQSRGGGPDPSTGTPIDTRWPPVHHPSRCASMARPRHCAKDDIMITPRRFAASCPAALITLLISACSTPPAPPVPESLDELAKQSLAQIEGELKVSGLKEPVEILRDRNGMPNIYAKNDSDMFFAQGYVIAQDRLWQLEMTSEE